MQMEMDSVEVGNQKLTTARDAWLIVGRDMWLACGLENIVKKAIVDKKTFCDYKPDDNHKKKILKSFAEKYLGYKVKQKTNAGKIVLVFDWSMSMLE